MPCLMNVGQEGVCANLRRHQVCISTIEPHTAGRRQIGMGIANTGGTRSVFDIRRTGADFEEVRGDEVIPSLQCQPGGGLLTGIQTLKAREFRATIDAA